MTDQARRGPTAGLVLLLLDAAFLTLAWRVAVLLTGGDPAGITGLLFPAAALVFLYALGLYRREALLEIRRPLGRLPVAAAYGSLTAWAALSFLPERFGSPNLHLLFAASVPCFAVAGLAARFVFFLICRQGAFRRRLLVIGAGRRAWDLIWMLRREARTLAFDVVFLHEPGMGEVDPRLAADPTIGVFPVTASILATVRGLNPDQIVVAPDERRGLTLEGLLACKMAGYPVSEYARFLEQEIGRIDLKRLDRDWLLYSDGFTMPMADRVLKRALDILVSTALLLFVAPTLLCAAMAVKLADRGPVFDRQNRVTRAGRVFGIMKLRTTMTSAEPLAADWAAVGKPRMTPVGQFLHRIRLDDVPRLVNVLKGEMSLVGPRSECPELTRDLAARLPLYGERHLVRAGLTGWAQVNYPEGASLNAARSKLSYDLFYVKNFGIGFDLLILLQTLRVVSWPDQRPLVPST
ncbi:sugar transferase [Falsiroseomonas sp. E2-1-a20]|uniref:sugar transferase n=1 Tax=Falsiroseomonas sp. E2-1-a20 TaxID=3239300 RepID=UPI003F3FD05D